MKHTKYTKKCLRREYNDFGCSLISVFAHNRNLFSPTSVFVHFMCFGVTQF